MAAVVARRATTSWSASLPAAEAVPRRLDRLARRDGGAAPARAASSPSGSGHRSMLGALVDLVGWDRFEAHRGVVATEQACPPVSLWTARCCRRGLPATAAVFADCLIGLRHVEVVTKILGSGGGRAACPRGVGRAPRPSWRSTPDGIRAADLHEFAAQLITALDQNGPEPRTPTAVRKLFRFPHLVARRRGHDHGPVRATRRCGP